MAPFLLLFIFSLSKWKKEFIRISGSDGTMNNNFFSMLIGQALQGFVWNDIIRQIVFYCNLIKEIFRYEARYRYMNSFFMNLHIKS